MCAFSCAIGRCYFDKFQWLFFFICFMAIEFFQCSHSCRAHKHTHPSNLFVMPVIGLILFSKMKYSKTLGKYIDILYLVGKENILESQN